MLPRIAKLTPAVARASKLTRNSLRLSYVMNGCSSLSFIPDHAEEVVAPLRVVRAFDAFGRRSVNDAENAAALSGLRYDHFHGIRRGTENVADFRRLLNALQHVHGE